jgi:hypothetical protein
VQVLQDANPSDPQTFITYTEAHKRLGIPILLGNPGRSLQIQGMNSLGTWTDKRGVPAITGLVVRETERDPGPGYFKANGKREIDDLPWWLDEMRRAKETDWERFIGGEFRTDHTHSTTEAFNISSQDKYSGEDERTLLDEARRIASLIFARVAISGTTVERTAPERSAPDDLVSNVRDLLRDDPFICYLCGGLMQMRAQNRLLQPSPDRIDSTIGDYGPENLKLAHLACNLGKNAASVSEYQEWLQVMRGKD